MITKAIFLLALLGVVSCHLPQRRTCDPEPVRETPTFCSNYKNIVHLDDVQTNLQEGQMMLQRSIDAVNIARIHFVAAVHLASVLVLLFCFSKLGACRPPSTAARLDAMKTELEAKLKKIQGAPQIAFSASLANSGEIYRGPSTDKILVFKRVFSNTGGYNQTTGIFTAPASGFYYFSFSTYGYNTHVTGAILMKNGVRQISTNDHRSSDGSDSSGNSAVLQLAKGDRVHMELWENGRVYDNWDGHTTFSGFLVFPA